MKLISAIILCIAAFTASADYTTTTMTPDGMVTCTNINGTMVCR